MHVSYPDTLHVWPPFSPAGLYGAPAVLLHISVAALISVVDVFFLQDGRCREAISVLRQVFFWGDPVHRPYGLFLRTYNGQRRARATGGTVAVPQM